MSLRESQQTVRQLVCLYFCLTLPVCFLFHGAMYFTPPVKIGSAGKLLQSRQPQIYKCPKAT